MILPLHSRTARIALSCAYAGVAGILAIKASA